MSGIRLDSVMGDLATAVQTVLASGRTAYGYPVEGVRQGDAVVGYPPDPIQVGTTFRRGQDRCTVPVFRICGLPQDAATVTEVSAAIDDSGSLITAIEGYAGTWSSVAVLTVRIDRFDPIGQPSLVAVRYDVDVIS